MFIISKEFTFSASHILTGLPDDHPCGRMHGHNYKVIVELSSPNVDGTGFVVDYGELSLFKQYLDSTFDHRHLNDLIPTQPSAENLAELFYHWCRQRWTQVTAVRVSETPKTWATYTPPPIKALQFDNITQAQWEQELKDRGLGESRASRLCNPLILAGSEPVKTITEIYQEGGYTEEAEPTTIGEPGDFVVSKSGACCCCSDKQETAVDDTQKEPTT